jgi:DNA-binding MarR family transcriptional regulator
VRAKHDLDVLTAVERGETVSQLTLSRRIGVAVGLINAVMKRAVRKGYVKVRTAPAKRYAYYLTPKGFSEKSRLVAEYLDYSLTFFRLARNEYVDLFQRAKASGHQHIAIAHEGELAEIAVLAAAEAGVTLKGVLAPGSTRATLFGLAVATSLDDLLPLDLIVITEPRQPQQCYDALVDRLGQDRVWAPGLLRIVTGRSARDDHESAEQGDAV